MLPAPNVLSIAAVYNFWLGARADDIIGSGPPCWGNDVRMKEKFCNTIQARTTLNDVPPAPTTVGRRRVGRRRRHVLVHKDFIIDNNLVSHPPLHFLFVSCRSFVPVQVVVGSRWQVVIWRELLNVHVARACDTGGLGEEEEVVVSTHTIWSGSKFIDPLNDPMSQSADNNVAKSLCRYVIS